MSLGLAIKRVYHFWDPSPRRWVRANSSHLAGLMVGLIVGTDIGSWSQDAAHRTLWIVLLVWIALGWWGGIGRDDAGKRR